MIDSFPTQATFTSPPPAEPRVPLIVDRLARALADEQRYQHEATAPATSPSRPKSGDLLQTLAAVDAAEAEQSAQATARAFGASARQAAGSSFFALALAITGIFTLALPLGMLATYLAGKSLADLCKLRCRQMQVMAAAAIALLLGATDAIVALSRVVGSTLEIMKQWSAT